MIVPTFIFAGGLTYAIAVNFIPSYRDPIDKTVRHLDGFESNKVEVKESGLESGINRSS
jgi:hypothetical protein